MRGVVIAAVTVVGLGCTATNPAYDEPRASTTEGLGTETGSEGETAAEEDSTGPEVRCEVHDEAPIGLQIREGTTVLVPDCSAGNRVYSTPVGRILYPPPGTFQLAGCTDPTCSDCQGQDVFFDFRGTMDNPPALPNCGRIHAWASEGPGGCEWQGLLLQQGDALLPFFIASNERDPFPVAPFEVGLESSRPCDGQCIGAAPGTYELVFFDQQVRVEDSPKIIDIDFANGGVPVPYEVIDRMSSVTELCRERVSWTARRAVD